MADANNSAWLSLTAPTRLQVLPLSLEWYSAPFALSAAVMAMPLAAAASTSLMPPTRVLTRTPTAPTGAPAVDSMVPKSRLVVVLSTGASLTGLTVTFRLWSSTLTLGAVPDPLSVTRQVTVPLPWALTTVLYVRPWSSDKLKPEVAVVTGVTPSALYKVRKLGMPVMAKLRVWPASSVPPPGL